MKEAEKTAEDFLMQREWMPDAGWTKKDIIKAMEAYAQSYHTHLYDKWMEELPADEAIEKDMEKGSNCDDNFVAGAKWMRDKIQNISKK